MRKLIYNYLKNIEKDCPPDNMHGMPDDRLFSQKKMENGDVELMHQEDHVEAGLDKVPNVDRFKELAEFLRSKKLT